MADDDDTVWLPILPSFRDFGRRLSEGTSGAGERAGRAVGEAMAGGVEASRAAVEKAVARVAAVQDKQADAAGKLTVAEAKLEDLRSKGITSGGRYAAAVEAVERAQRGSQAATRTAATAADQLAAAQARAATATDEVAGSARRGDGALKGLFSGMGGGIKQLAGLAAGAAGLSGAIGGISTAMANEVTTDKLNAALGSTPAAAKQYGELAGQVYAQAYGDNLGDVTTAIDAVSSTLGGLDEGGAYLDDGSMERVTKKALDFAAVYGTDVSESVQTVNQLIGNGLAGSADEGFDQLVSSFQKVPAAMRGELPEILNEYGTNFRALGLDGDEAFSVLIGAAQNGKFALDKTGDALKEFTIRGSDMSTASVAAYDAIGLNATDMAAKIAAGGDGAQEALQATAQGLLQIENPADRANAAIALFGTPLEDLSVDQIPEFLGSLADIPDRMQDAAGSADEMGQTLNDNVATRITEFGRGIQSNIVGILGDNALPMLDEFTSGLGATDGSLLATVAGMTGMTGAVAGFEQVQGVFGSVKDGVGSVKDGFVSAKDGIKSAWDTASKAGDWVGQKARAVGSFVATSASATVNAAKTAGTWVAAQARIALGWAATATRAAVAFAASAASAIVQAAITSGAWIGAQAAAGAGWLAMQARAVGSFVAMGAAAAVQALRASGAWVASTARTVGALAVQGGAFVAQRTLMIAGAAATGIMTGAQWLLNAALNANPIGLVIIALTALVAGIVLAYQNSETFRNIVQAAFTAVADAGKWMYENVLKPAFDGIMSAFRSVGDFLSSTGSAIGGVFDSVGNSIGSAFSGALDVARPALRGIGNLLNAIPDKIFGLTIPGMGTVRSFAAKLQSLRTGGVVAGRRADGTLYGPGTGTSDSLVGVDGGGMPIVRVSAGEGVVKDAAMRGGGAPVVAALNAGWVPSPQFLAGMLPGLSGGGMISADQLNAFPRENGLEGDDYDWGGINWGDCSGAMSALANFATGRDPFGSRFATGNMREALAERGFQPGLGPAGSFNLGWYNGGPYGGHTAGTLPDGTNVEMGGARGNGQVGGGAAGADDPSFTDHAHLPPEFFVGGDALPGVDLNTEMGSAGTPDVSTSGGGADVSSSASTASGLSSSSSASSSGSSSSSSSGASSMTLSEFAGETASNFATETLGDTLDFFGLGKLADLPIIPVSQPTESLAQPPADVQGVEGQQPPPPEAPSGPLVQLGDVQTMNIDELVRKIFTEVNHLSRSDAASVGGWL